ncbi:MAG TPA: hypothetical protein VM709_07835 [Candidatus Sulfotelmatobacter sp.]|nr:hypothetical protein [Candidatus Sulfotelmatobacter sp.]
MRKAICFFSLLSLAVFSTPLLMAQSKKVEATDLPEHPFQVDYPSGSQVSLHLRSGDVRVVGKEHNQISVRVEARDTERAREVKVYFERFENSAELRVWGGPKNDLQIIVEVPKNTGLFVRMPAGQLEISDVTGDKDVQLHAGDLILHVGDPADYSHVDASVTTGGLEAPPFHEDHGGLFRSFQKSGNGRYRLHAHVGAGDLTLR